MSLDHAHALNPSDELRALFPTLERLTYLNSCSQGVLSRDVEQAMQQFLVDWREHGSPWELWVEKAEEARAAFARLVGAAVDEVALTSSVSAAVSAVASGLRFEGQRRKVVLTDVEFPTVGQIWHAQEERGAEVVHARDLESAIDERTLIVSLTHVSYETGERLDAAAVAGLARDRGALVLLDAYQSAGTIPLDMDALGVDFLAAGTVKYLLGTAGLAFLYCRRDLVEELRPTATGWFADEDVFAMNATRYAPAPTAARFQSGTPPVPAVYAGLAGLGLVERADPARTEQHVLALGDRLLDCIDELGGRAATPRSSRGALVAIRSSDADALAAALLAAGIVTSTRAGNVRVSPHFYNSHADIERLLAALEKHRWLLR